MVHISLTSYFIKFGRVYTFAEDVISLLDQKPIRDALLVPKVKTLQEILEEFNITAEGLLPELKEKLNGLIEEQRRLVEGYALTIINQSLQIDCSLFENFLIESLEIIFDTKKETIINVSEQKIIKLEEMVKLGDYDKIVAYFKDKILITFSRASTRDQFEKYLGGLGLKEQNFFDMSRYKTEVQEAYKGWDLEKLISIFDERHNIVHNGALPLRSLKDLYVRHEFFNKLVLNISIEIYNKFGIPNDLNLPTASQK
jgi:hypothetical protein